MEGFRSYSAEDSRAQTPKPKQQNKANNNKKQFKQKAAENKKDDEYTFNPYLVGGAIGVLATLSYPFVKEASQYLWNKYQVGPKIYRLGNHMKNRLYNGATALKNQFNKGARFIGNKIADGLLSASNYIRPSNTTAPTTPTPLPSADAIGHG